MINIQFDPMQDIINSIKKYIATKGLVHFSSVAPVSLGLTTDASGKVVTSGYYVLNLKCAYPSKNLSNIGTNLVKVSFDSTQLILEMKCLSNSQTLNDIYSILSMY